MVINAYNYEEHLSMGKQIIFFRFYMLQIPHTKYMELHLFNIYILSPRQRASIHGVPEGRA